MSQSTLPLYQVDAFSERPFAGNPAAVCPLEAPIPEALMQLRDAGVPIDPDDVTFFLGRETIVVTDRPGMAKWRENLFVLMARNAVRATAFFKLPPERVVELGVQVEM